jgi:hypothetical protein
MVSIEDMADRAPQALADEEVLSIGRHSVRWFDTPHLPHAWECGYLMEEATKTLLCGDLFTQGGAGLPPLTESDILVVCYRDSFYSTFGVDFPVEGRGSCPRNMSCS